MEMDTSPSTIVPDVLKEDNYERWSILMEHYLVAQDLWGVVRSSEIIGGNKREWIKKNALALHAIGISCGREAFDQIKNKRSAKVAWDALAAKLKPPSNVQDATPPSIVQDATPPSIVQDVAAVAPVAPVAPDISEPHQERQTGLLAGEEELQKLVCYESISEVKRFLDRNQDMKSPQMLDSALKHAITCGRKEMARYLYREIPLDFLRGYSGFFLLEHCMTNGMFDIALGLLHDSSRWAFEHPSNSTSIVLTLAQTAPPFLSINELGSWGRWIYKSTRVKAFPIKPRSALAGGVGIVQDKLREWILRVLYKFHLVCVMIGLLCWMPCWLPGVRIQEVGMLFAFELLLLLFVPFLKLDLLCVLIGVPLFWLLVPHGELILFLKEFAVFILLLVILRVILRKLDKEPSRKPELPRILRIAAEPLRMPIGVPLLFLGAPISLLVRDKSLTGLAYFDGALKWSQSVATKDLMRLRVAFFSLFLLFSIPLLIFVIQKYELKLADEYAHEVVRFICRSLSTLEANQFLRSGAVEATHQAIENDIPEIVFELLKGLNGKILLSNTDPEDSRNMFVHAVAHRQEKVARFLYDEFGERKDTNMVTATDEDKNNVLHIAARLAPHSQLSHISGAALQLQSELHWFKSVEGIVPQFKKQKNKDGEIPTQVFLEEHKNLVEEAERWMKKVATSCTVVGALVITIMFAASFTVPGGNDDKTGIPIFLNKTNHETFFAVVPFTVFLVSDAISLFAATSSVLMFMGILTSRYACQDFHISLPIKLICGLSLLFISIAAMMVAFCATLLMMIHDKMGMVISIIFLAAIPVTLFILLQSPLLVEIYRSTFRPDIFNRRRGYWKYGKNVCSCFNRRWWLKMRRGWMVVMLCALVLLYYVSLNVFLIKLYGY